MKRIATIFLKIVILAITITTIFTKTSKASFWSDIFGSGNDFLETGKQEQYNTNAGGIPQASDAEVQSIISNIYNIVFPLGIVITVIVGGILGIKFMMASAEDKAKLKESMIPYCIGCAVIYGAFGIWRIAIEIVSVLS